MKSAVFSVHALRMRDDSAHLDTSGGPCDASSTAMSCRCASSGSDLASSFDAV